ncbi:hypothetical protein EW146_g3352 [Bondarzewia mesenterica]|uniref:Uncharacterized protein n=1 Tax=Bondarzewia mesenterica TaxID=1095465 RepID=A0A4S4LZM7_9AGAM|nr:hypothetical protein EW146_g3352 [Bondarzewia mesenterica]
MSLTLDQCIAALKGHPKLPGPPPYAIPILQLEDGKDTKPATTSLSPDFTAGAWVVDTALVSFADVIDSVLYAQLQADVALDLPRDEAVWYAKFRTTLQSCGWTVNKPFEVTPINKFNIDGPAFEVIQNELYEKLTPVQYGLLVNTIAALRLSGNVRAKRLLNLNGVKPKYQAVTVNTVPLSAAKFIAGVCSPTPSGNVIFDLGLFSYDFAPPDVLFGFKGCISNFKAGFQKIELNEGTYAGIRNEIKTRIENQIVPYTADINLSEFSQDSGDEKVNEDWEYESTTDDGVFVGTIDIATLDFLVDAYIRIATRSWYRLGQKTGNLKNYIVMDIDKPGLAVGSLNFHLERTTTGISRRLYCFVKLKTYIGDFYKHQFLFDVP